MGSFSVIAGKAMVICDPGSEIYTARTFSAHRYDSKVLNSYGHAVPVVAGQLQQPGAEAKAVVLRSDLSDGEDTLALDLHSAYAVPELTRLERTFVFRRTGAVGLSVRDEVAFSEPKGFETALITWGDWKRRSEKELVVADDLVASFIVDGHHLPAEVFPKNVVGTVTGLGGFLGGVSGGVAQLVIGGVLMKYGYGPIFAVCSVMYLAALAAVHILIGELGVIRKMPLQST